MNTAAMRIEVVVEWTKEAELQGYTWPAWILIGIYGDLVRLEARHDHDALHEGGCIWAHSRLIRGMSETS